ncbi:MAG: hypothetical protein IJE18_08530 [Bacteroidaceae bacterium]|nr:hypothetical protein [Bacteroidaceae bacterium]
MIRALIQLIITPQKAWNELSRDIVRQQYLMWLLVYPLLIFTALSAYIHHWYGYTTVAEASQEALLTLLQYGACIMTTWILLTKLGPKYFAASYSNSEAHLYSGYVYTLTMLATLIGNILPSDFAFVQFLPMYSIWIVYQARQYMKIPQENIFSYTVITSVVILGLPFVWQKIFDLILH